MIWILLIALVYIDSMAIYYAHKSGMYEPIQLFFQGLLILVLPFVGALFVLNMALSQLKSLPQRSQLCRQSPDSSNYSSYLLFWFPIVIMRNKVVAHKLIRLIMAVIAVIEVCTLNQLVKFAREKDSLAGLAYARRLPKR